MLQPTLDQRGLAGAAGGDEFDQGGFAGGRPGGVEGGEFVLTAKEGRRRREVGEVGGDVVVAVIVGFGACRQGMQNMGM